MRISLFWISAVAGLTILAGCNGIGTRKELFTVDFQEGKSLRYKFVSDREIQVDLDPTKNESKSGRSSVQKMTERMELVVAYEPIEVDPYGFTTLQVRCESAKVWRSSLSGRGSASQKDAVRSCAGRSFKLCVRPSGRIQDRTQLNQLISQLGQKAFSGTIGGGRIKDPDMILDFIATQWFLWDSISSIEKPIEGAAPGQSWHSQLSVPLPVPLRVARDTTYTLDEITDTEKGRVAVIKSTYSLAESAPSEWPMPYGGQFQMRGIFGFLRGYKVLEVQGAGEQLFDIETGTIIEDRQEYEVKARAVFPFALRSRSGGVSPNPNMIIKQELSMQLLEN